MAIQTLSFISLILRPYVQQPISTDGWRHLLAQADPHRNFDGEIMAFGAMSGRDIDCIIEELISFGYIGPGEGDQSDMVVSDMFSVGSNIPAWLELVDVKFFDESRPPTQAWKMKQSNVYRLIDFEASLATPTKGYECDWPPYIGKI
ncbi:MAG: hypothetical protein AAED33_12875 [Paracoccaceae bacterium]